MSVRSRFVVALCVAGCALAALLYELGLMYLRWEMFSAG